MWLKSKSPLNHSQYLLDTSLCHTTMTNTDAAATKIPFCISSLLLLVHVLVSSSRVHSISFRCPVLCTFWFSILMHFLLQFVSLLLQLNHKHRYVRKLPSFFVPPLCAILYCRILCCFYCRSLVVAFVLAYAAQILRRCCVAFSWWNKSHGAFFT